MMIEPKLRFKADDGSDFPDWESSTVGELFTFVTEKNESGCIGDVITNSAEYGLIPQREYFDKDIAVEGNTEGYTVIHKGDFVYNPRKSTIAPFGPFNIYARDEAGIVSPLYTCLTPRDGKTAPYLSWYFKTSRWHRYIVTHGAQGGARHDRVGMTNILMKGIPITLPSLPEQRKIADLLSAVDDVISAQEAEVAAWEKRKKGVMQKLFSQEVRFKADDGSDFSDWEEKALGEIIREYREYHEKDGTYEHVSLTKDGVISKTERYDRDYLVKCVDKKYRVTHMNDICYNPANLKFGVICRNTYGDGIFSPIYVTYRVNESYDPIFIEALVVRDAFIQQALRFQEGTVYERMSVSPSDFESMFVSVPSLPEQRKIADCFTSLGDVIAKAKDELDAWRELKKGLLQQMFV